MINRLIMVARETIAFGAIINDGSAVLNYDRGKVDEVRRLIEVNVKPLNFKHCAELKQFLQISLKDVS